MGQARGFEEFYQACYGRLLRQLALMTTDLADAEDVLQAAFARAALRWWQLETYDVPEAWVRRVAMNLAADKARRLRRRTAAMLRLGPPSAQPELSADTVVQRHNPGEPQHHDPLTAHSSLATAEHQAGK